MRTSRGAPRHRYAVGDLNSAGVNLFAYLRGQFGLGESARMYARALLDRTAIRSR